MIDVPPAAPAGSVAGPTPGFTPPAPSPVRLVSDAAGALDLSSAAEVKWHLRPGVAPARSEFVVVAPRAEEWLSRVGDEFVTLEYDGRHFHKLRVVRSLQTDPWHVAITVCDRRYRWRFYRFHGRINLRRRSGVLRLATTLIEESEEASTSIGEDAKRDDLSTVAEEVYREWSVKTDGTPYTALELLVLVLRALHEELDEADDFDAQSSKRIADNGEIVDQQEYIGDLYIDIIGDLLQRAEVALAVDTDGKVRLYSPFEQPVLPAVQIKGGALRVPGLDRIRPAVFEVRALVEQELRGVFNTQAQKPNADNVDPRKGKPRGEKPQEPDNTFALQNVLKLLYPLTIDGVEHRAGEYVLADSAIPAMGFTDSDVRKGFMFGGWGLREKYARRVGGGRIFYDPVVMLHIRAVLGGYRQLWRIEPAMMNRIRSWSDRTVAIIHEQSHEREKSPLYTEWCDVFPALPLLQRRGEPGNFMENGSSFLDRNSRGELVTARAEPVTAPGAVVMVDEQLGIMQSVLHPALDGGVADRIPSKIDPEPTAVNTRGLSPSPRVFYNLNIQLAEHHRTEIVISAILGTPNVSDEAPLDGKKPHYLKRYKNAMVPDGGKALQPKLQLFVRGDTARVDENNRLVNRTQIEALMKAEALAAARSYIDRPLGILTVAHKPTDNWRLTGHLLGITFTRTTRGADSVTINAGEPPPDERTTRYLPQRVRQFLFKVLSGTDAMPKEN